MLDFWKATASPEAMAAAAASPSPHAAPFTATPSPASASASSASSPAASPSAPRVDISVLCQHLLADGIHVPLHPASEPDAFLHQLLFVNMLVDLDDMARFDQWIETHAPPVLARIMQPPPLPPPEERPTPAIGRPTLMGPSPTPMPANAAAAAAPSSTAAPTSGHGRQTTTTAAATATSPWPRSVHARWHATVPPNADDDQRRQPIGESRVFSPPTARTREPQERWNHPNGTAHSNFNDDDHLRHRISLPTHAALFASQRASMAVSVDDQTLAQFGALSSPPPLPVSSFHSSQHAASGDVDDPSSSSSFAALMSPVPSIGRLPMSRGSTADSIPPSSHLTVADPRDPLLEALTPLLKSHRDDYDLDQ